MNQSCWICRVFFVCLFCFLGPHPCHMEIPRPGVESELQLPAHTEAIATWDLSHVCNLDCSSQQCQILNPLIEAKDWTHILMDTSRVLNPLSHNGNSTIQNFNQIWHDSLGEKILWSLSLLYTEWSTPSLTMKQKGQIRMFLRWKQRNCGQIWREWGIKDKWCSYKTFQDPSPSLCKWRSHFSTLFLTFKGLLALFLTFHNPSPFTLSLWCLNPSSHLLLTHFLRKIFSHPSLLC